MKKWLQNLSGAVMASLLAITLNSKAYADVEEQTLPAEASTEFVEAAPAPAASPESVAAPAVPAVLEAPSAAVPTLAAVPATPAAETVPAVLSAAAPVVSVAVPVAVAASPAAPDAAETSAAVDKKPVVAESAPAAEQLAVPEVPTAAEASAVEAKTAIETPDVDTVVAENPLDTPAEAPAPAVETQTTEKEKIAEPEEPAVKEKAQQAVNETVLEDDKDLVQEVNEKDASSGVPVKLTTQKKLSMTKDGLSSDGESGATANLLSVQEDSEKTDSLEEKEEEQSKEQLEEQPEEKLEEPLIKLAKRGITADESGIDEGEGETKAAATRGTGGEDTNAQTNQNSVFSQNADGSYVLVNYTSSESLSATNGDIVVLAAGFNHISSIFGTGKVIIAGTGILLVDSLQGDLDLQTFTGIYSEGSVAVFVKDGNNYVLANGSTPGILDEQYELKNATLVMPENTTLLLCGTGAALMQDGSIVYYHGYDVDAGKAQGADSETAVESVGKLTIADRASLILQKGASIILENLRSLGGTETYDNTRYPELIVADGGKLTLDADSSVGNGGFVTIDGNVSGSGSVTARRITINNLAAINSSQVSLSSPELHLNGSGTIENLTIHDSVVHQGSNVTEIRGLVSSGNSKVIIKDGSSLQISKVDGMLYLNTRNGGEATVSGNMEGSGTICFDQGSFKLPAGTKLNGVEVSNDSWGDVYDYAEELSLSITPLHVGPEKVNTPGQNSGVVTVGVAQLYYTDYELQGGKAFSATSINAISENGSWVLKQEEIEKLIKDCREANNCSGDAVVQLLHLKEGVLSLTNYPTSSTAQSSASIAADDVCLIRICFILNDSSVAPAVSPTQTGTTFTGSGILGGSGAGSVSFGHPGSDPQPIPGPDPGPQPTPDPDPDPRPTPDPDPDPKPTPDPDPKPTPLVTHLEEDTGPAQVWVEVAPAINNNVASPTEIQYVLLALEGEKTLEELGGKATVSMNYTPPAEYTGKQLYVVFRNEDGSLTAIRATYSNITKLLSFITDRLGTFMVVGFEFDGVEFPEKFYEALAQIPELKDLVFAEYSPV